MNKIKRKAVRPTIARRNLLIAAHGTHCVLCAGQSLRLKVWAWGTLGHGCTDSERFRGL